MTSTTLIATEPGGMTTVRAHGRKPICLDFAKLGRRQFDRLNQKLGAQFIRGFVLRHELAAFIAAHENANAQLDTICQEVHYSDGVYLLLKCVQGIWYITDIFLDAIPDGATRTFFPVFVWQSIRRGVRLVLRQVLCGWRETYQQPKREVKIA